MRAQGVVLAVVSAMAYAKISSSLMTKLETSNGDAVISFHVEPRRATEAAKYFPTRTARLNFVAQELQQRSASIHDQFLKQMGNDGALFTPTYINGKVYVKNATKALLNKAAAIPLVKSIDEQVTIRGSLTSNSAREFDEGNGPPSDTKYAMKVIEAPTVWSAGYKGSGIVVGSIDTGVRHTHEAIRDNWREEYGWFDPQGRTPTPRDYGMNGTHAVGLMVGTVGHFGIAPEAKWTACAAFNANGVATEQSLMECAQFLLCPTDVNGENADCSKAPHVINNGWGLPEGNTFFDEALAAWREAGIVPVFAVGFDGERGCGHISYPASSDLVIGVGATDENEVWFSGSSLGPTTDGRLKPDIVAPGSVIVSASSTGDGIYLLLDGTHTAAPLVSGTIALYLSAFPGATFEEVYQALTLSAETDIPWPYQGSCGGVSGETYPNNGYGYGRLNARKVMTLLPSPSSCPLATTFVDYPGNDIVSTRRVHPKDCCEDCINTPGCKLFTWDLDLGGTCYLKHSKSKRVYVPYVWSGALEEKPTTCGQQLQDIGFVDFVIATVTEASADLCCARCRRTGNCRGYSWTANSGTCVLHDEIANKVAAPGVTSGVIQFTARD